MMSLNPYNRYSTRLPVLVAVFFSLPICLLFGFFLNTKNSQIEFTNKEIMGLQYLYPLGQMAFQIFDLLLASPASNQADLAVSLESLKQAEEKLATQVGTDPHALFIRSREHLSPKILIEQMEISLAKQDTTGLYKQLVQILELIHHVGDTSNLILDPDLDSYYLMDLTLLVIPKFMKYLLDTGVLREKAILTDWSNQSGIEILITYDMLPALHSKTASALREDPNFYGVSPSLTARMTGSLQNLTQNLQKLNSGIQTNQEPKILHQQLIKSMATLKSFWLISHSELDALLELRARSLKDFRLAASLISLALWGSSMLLTAYSLKNLKKMQSSNEYSYTQFQNMSLRQKMTLHGAIDAIISIDQKGTIIEFNPAAENIFGREKSTVIGKTLAETIIPDSHLERHTIGLQKYLNENRKDNMSRRIKLPGKHSSGREFPMELSLVAIHLPNSEIVFTAFIRDLSNQERLETEAKLHQSKLVTASRLSSLGEMAGGIAHEVKNPLAIIDGNLQNLLGFMKSPNADLIVPKTINTMRRSIVRISKIIDGLRTFARSGDTDPFEKVSPKLLIEECLDLCRSRLESSGITVSTHLNGQNSIFCRPVQISQVLVNLLNNAHDAVATTKNPWIEIDLLEEGDFCLICVTDSGPRIPQNIAEKMLQPFFTTKPVGKGTGLGLSISLGIVQSHQGSLELDQKHPHTRFLVRLPAEPLQIHKKSA